MTNSLLSKSIENDGVSTIVNHLLYNYSKLTKNTEYILILFVYIGFEITHAHNLIVQETEKSAIISSS